MRPSRFTQCPSEGSRKKFPLWRRGYGRIQTQSNLGIYARTYEKENHTSKRLSSRLSDMLSEMKSWLSSKFLPERRVNAPNLRPGIGIMVIVSMRFLTKQELREDIMCFMKELGFISDDGLSRRRRGDRSIIH
jgi:hypothetical protein